MCSKKIMALFLTVAMLLSYVPAYAQNPTDTIEAPVSSLLTDQAPDLAAATEMYDEVYTAEEYYASGTLENGVAWIAEYGMLTIGGTGDMPNFEMGETPWYEGREGINFVYIAEGITSLGDYAFYDLTNLKGIYISEGVTSIGKGAFMQCSVLPDIKLPDSLKFIESSAFKGCNNFKKVTVPDSVEGIAPDAFSSCLSLVQYNVSDKNKAYAQIDGVLFTKDLETLVAYPTGRDETSYTVPNGVKNIDSNAFEGCDVLESVKFPKGLLTIGENAFTNCSAIETFDIPASVTHIAQNAFLYGCDSLKAINVDENNANYSSDMGVLYSKDKTRLIQFPSNCDPYAGTIDSAWYAIDAKVKVIGKEAFLNCSAIEYLQIYGGLEKIEMAAFMGFDSLVEISFGGLQSRWEQVEKENFNEILDEVDIYFMSPVDYETTFTAYVGETYHLEDYVTVDTSLLEYLVVDTDKPLVVSVDVEKMEMMALSEGEATIIATTCKDGNYIIGAAKVIVTKKDGGSQSEDIAINLVQYDVTDIKKSISIPQEYLNRFSWSSSNTGVATVDDGVVTAIAPGTAQIVAKTEDNRYVIKFNIAVEAKYTPEDQFVFSNGVIIKYIGNDEEVSIPPTIGGEEVVAIGDKAFANWTRGQKLEMPESITKIGAYAFSNCSNLKNIVLHEGITNIGNYAFTGCIGLIKIVIPSTVNHDAGYNWFTECSALKTVEFASGTKSIGRGIRYAESVRNVIIPKTVTSIGYSAFSGCTSLASIDIPDSVTGIGSSAFSGCNMLQKVTIGKKVATVGSSCFENCSKLTTVKIGSSLKALSYRMFYRCTKLKTISIPKTVTSIESNAFGGCTSLQTVTLVSGLKEIKISAFADCTSLSTITIPSTVTFIGNTVFARSGLTEITIPSSTTLGNSVFADCTKLKKADISGAKSILSGLFMNCTSLTEVKLNSAVTKIEEKAFYNCKSLVTITIPDTVTTIGNYAFYNCKALDTVSGCKGLTTIGGYSFYGCTSLKSLILGSNLTEIGDYALAYSGINTFVIPNSVTVLGQYVFYGCSYLTDVTFGSGIKSVSGNILSGCTSVKNIVLSEGITTIEGSAFSGNSSLKTIKLPDSLTSIGSSAFYGCTALTNVDFGKGLKTIGAYAFYNCRVLESVTLPDSVTSIANHAFYQCYKIHNLDLGKGVKGIGNYAFYYCYGITDLDIPESVTTIGNYAFYYCYSITELVIPDSVTSLGNCSFAYCKALREVALGKGLKTVGSNAFYGCSNLTFSGGISSEVAKYIMNSNLFGDGTFTIESYNYFNVENTGYTSLVEDFYTYIPFELKFSLKDEYVNAKSKSIVINIPESAYLINGTMELDGEPYTNYKEYENAQYGYNRITVNIDDSVTEGTLTFYIKPTVHTKILTYAEMSMYISGKKTTEFMGFVNASLPEISLSVPDTMGQSSFVAEGLSAPNTTVSIYVDGTRKKQVKTSSAGVYKTTISLSGVRDYQEYVVNATATVDGVECSVEKTVKYISSTPNLTGMYLYYGKNGYSKTAYNLYNVTARPVISWGDYWTSSGRDYSYYFTVSLSNTSSVDKVYVVSTRDNKKQYLEAKYNASTGKYVTTGYFAGDCEYIPGVLTVEYTRKKNAGNINASNAVSYMQFEGNENVFTPVITEYSTSTFGASVNVDSAMQHIFGSNIDVKSETTDRDYSGLSISDLYDNEMPGTYASATTINGQLYYLVYELANMEGLVINLHDVYGNKQTTYTIGFANKWTEDDMEFIENIPSEIILDQIVNYAGKLLSVYNIEFDTEKLMSDIASSNLSQAKKDEAYNRVTTLERNRKLFVLASMGISASTVGKASAPVKVLDVMYASLYSDISYFASLKLMNIYKIGSEVKIRWKIDPSGYVYEGVTDNRLPGVTTTAYCVPNEDVVLDANGNLDESATNFENKVVWDALELEQLNPLITDQNGEYKWFVPDGYWWQVEYKMEGYETAYSKWVPVPPAQTDVNIGLVSKAAPKVEKIYLTADYLVVTFDKYMDPSTLTNVKIGDAAYTVEYDKTKTDLDGNNFANEYTFKFANSFLNGETVNISIKGAKSYAGVAMTDYVASETTPGEPLAKEIIFAGVSDDVTSGEIKVDFFNNAKDDKTTFDAICAIYNDKHELVSVEKITIEDFEKGKRTEKVFTFVQPWSYYKIYNMSSLSNLKPITKSYDSRNAQ